jgi:hypothetical protein
VRNCRHLVCFSMRTSISCPTHLFAGIQDDVPKRQQGWAQWEEQMEAEEAQRRQRAVEVGNTRGLLPLNALQARLVRPVSRGHIRSQ